MENLKFKGDITPAQAWSELVANADAVVIDVRTAAEWVFVGGPDLASLGRSVAQVEWQVFPCMSYNELFVESILALNIHTDRPLYFICRSGVRSRFAAEIIAEHGYTTYNIADGFEGQLSNAGHRGLGGWREQGLPWRQS